MKRRRQSKKKRSQASLFHAAEEGMVEVVADLIKGGADVNEKNHQTALHSAAANGQRVFKYPTPYVSNPLFNPTPSMSGPGEYMEV